MEDGIDHLVIAAASLESGMHFVEERLGVRPGVGGRHPQWGTHNALLSLGDTTYLEVIAPDPSLPAPDAGVLFAELDLTRPRLLTWVLRVADLAGAWQRARESGVGLGDIQTGSRARPDGSILRWTLTDPAAMPDGGAVPFLIDWGDTPHPAGSAARGGAFRSLRIEHPAAERVRTSLDSLGADVPVTQASAFRLVCTIEVGSRFVEID